MLISLPLAITIITTQQRSHYFCDLKTKSSVAFVVVASGKQLLAISSQHTNNLSCPLTFFILVHPTQNKNKRRKATTARRQVIVKNVMLFFFLFLLLLFFHRCCRFIISKRKNSKNGISMQRKHFCFSLSFFLLLAFILKCSTRN